VEIVEGGNEQASVTPTAVAGVVSFEISNPTDGYHGVQINRMLPGVTIEEVRADALELARTGAESSNLEEDPLLGVVNGPHDHFVTAIPLEAGEYAVLLTATDESFAGAPDADGHGVRQLTITTGSAGSAPTPTLTFDRIAEDDLIGPPPRRRIWRRSASTTPLRARSSSRSWSSPPTRRSTISSCGRRTAWRAAASTGAPHQPPPSGRFAPVPLRKPSPSTSTAATSVSTPDGRLIKAVPSPSSGSPSTDSGKHPPHAARSRR